MVSARACAARFGRVILMALQPSSPNSSWRPEPICVFRGEEFPATSWWAASVDDCLPHRLNRSTKISAEHVVRVFGAGTAALEVIGHVRVGLEDNLWVEKGKLATSNPDQVRKLRRVVEELGMEVATPDQARAHTVGASARERRSDLDRLIAMKEGRLPLPPVYELL